VMPLTAAAAGGLTRTAGTWGKDESSGMVIWMGETGRAVLRTFAESAQVVVDRDNKGMGGRRSTGMRWARGGMTLPSASRGQRLTVGRQLLTQQSDAGIVMTTSDASGRGTMLIWNTWSRLSTSN
jgi:hypothetical protein